MTQPSPPVALITGASQRIGKAITQSLHHNNHNVIVHFNSNKLFAQELVNTLNLKRANSALAIQADLSKPKELSTLARKALKHWGNMNVLINNASVFEQDLAFNNNLDDKINERLIQWENIMNTNTRAAWLLSNELQPALKSSNGNIINIVDIYSERPLKAHLSYSVSKAGLAMMCKSLALEFAPEIRVNGISPGAILWPNSSKSQSESKKQQEILNKIPLGRLGSTKAITEAVNFLTNCDYISGQVINIDGGRSITI